MRKQETFAMVDIRLQEPLLLTEISFTNINGMDL